MIPGVSLYSTHDAKEYLLEQWGKWIVRAVIVLGVMAMIKCFA